MEPLILFVLYYGKEENVFAFFVIACGNVPKLWQ